MEVEESGMTVAVGPLRRDTRNSDMNSTVSVLTSSARSAEIAQSEPDGDGAIRPVIHLIEDNAAMREAGRNLFECAGWDVQDYVSAEDFLASARPTGETCLVIDVNLPGMDGLSLLEALRAENSNLPAIMLTGRRDATTAVAAMKAGAADFIEKPADHTLLLASVVGAMAQARVERVRIEARAQAKARFNSLTEREREIMMMVLEGAPNKNIAADLGISQRTVESHRAGVMKKTGSRSLPALVQLFIEANAPD